jgi:hypothetical protein
MVLLKAVFKSLTKLHTQFAPAAGVVIFMWLGTRCVCRKKMCVRKKKRCFMWLGMRCVRGKKNVFFEGKINRRCRFMWVGYYNFFSLWRFKKKNNNLTTWNGNACLFSLQKRHIFFSRTQRIPNHMKRLFVFEWTFFFSHTQRIPNHMKMTTPAAGANCVCNFVRLLNTVLRRSILNTVFRRTVYADLRRTVYATSLDSWIRF